MRLLLLFVALPVYLLIRYLLKHDPGPPEPKRALWEAAGFGLLALILTIIVGGVMAVLYSDPSDMLSPSLLKLDLGYGELFVNVFAYATLEEALKFIPVAIFIYKRNYFNEVTDGIIYFAFIGLAFGAIETAMYGASFGQGVMVHRLILGLFFHAATTSYVGYYLAKVKMAHVPWSRVYVAFGVAMVAHTLYNYGFFIVEQVPIAIFMSMAVSIGINCLLFWDFFQAIRLDYDLGIAPWRPAVLPPSNIPSSNVVTVVLGEQAYNAPPAPVPVPQPVQPPR